MIPQLMPLTCLGWLIGIGIGSVYLDKAAFFLVGTFALTFFMFRKNNFVKCCSLFIFLISLGYLYSAYITTNDQAKTSLWRSFANKPIIIEGQVGYWEESFPNTKLIVENVTLLKDKNVIFPGVLEITSSSVDGIRENDYVRLVGKIKVPDEASRSESGHFNPRRHYAKDGIYGVMNNPKISLVKKGGVPIFSKVRDALRKNIQAAVPEPAAGLFNATLLGYMHDVPKEIRNEFSASGLAHLVAISGQHIAMLAVVIFFLCLQLGLSRNIAALTTCIVSFFFIVLVNFPASGIRSIFMLAVVYWAYAAGRRAQTLRALLLAATIMTILNPRILLADLGFQLSALAMFGLAVFFPVLSSLYNSRNFVGLRSVLFMTCSAILTTTPIIAYAFGRISLIGILSNILAAPIYPVLMILGTFLALLGRVSVIQTFFAPLAYHLTGLFLELVNFSANLPGANIAVANFSATKVLAVYFVFALTSVLLLPSVRMQFFPALRPEQKSGTH